MEKFKFITEYELRASPKMLFPYISTASGLSQWFASKVNTMPEQRFDFQWDNESHIARQVSMRQNKGVRFEFLDTDENNASDNNYVDFRVDQSELTQSTFLRITDYSSTTDEEELKDLWDGLMDKLKEIVGS
ncbi:ATPase [Spirosoma sp. KCTC 42546]|uniref:START-like domain-containing protein n=1 Tax=Spirosoma sp. KCTC 42546 TaxID=2520506 RepID=UPI00115B67B8|nr:START-like domain-containing protein [Spirosoma sp. KCTC 42546]QDK79986.1 ATPase [Spirosoma sp. KCTC 42546]